MVVDNAWFTVYSLNVIPLIVTIKRNNKINVGQLQAILLNIMQSSRFSRCSCYLFDRQELHIGCWTPSITAGTVCIESMSTYVHVKTKNNFDVKLTMKMYVLYTNITCEI